LSKIERRGTSAVTALRLSIAGLLLAALLRRTLLALAGLVAIRIP
jgi:threonine/homoserine efflux transporter RhtA